MWAIIQRGALPVLLLLGAVASWIYGAKFHSAPVVEEREIEVSLAPPAPFPSLPGFEEAPPFLRPPPFLNKVKKKILVVKDEFEPALMREVSVGGVSLLASGELKRTYSGKAPSLCPT